MTGPGPPEDVYLVPELVPFLLAEDRYKRALAEHQPVGPRGQARCAACSMATRSADWPCVVHIAAAQAQEFAELEAATRKGASDGNAPEAEPGAGPVVALPPEPTGQQSGTAGGRKKDH